MTTTPPASKPTTIDWAARVALITIGLYVAIVLFEVGYFWKLGGAVMAMFSPTEHAVHAVGKMGIAIVILIAAASALTYPQVVLQVYEAPTRAELEQGPAVRDRPAWVRHSLLALFVAAVAIASFNVLRVLFHDSGWSPMFIFGCLVAITMIHHAVETALVDQARTYRMPLLLLVLFILPAFGSASYLRNATSPSASEVSVIVDGKPAMARLLFGGTDKFLFLHDGGIYLQDYEGTWQRRLAQADGQVVKPAGEVRR